MATLSPGPSGRPTLYPATNSSGDQVLLTSWHAGSGRPEEDESPAQAAWQPASAQHQIQAGLQGCERALWGPPAGRLPPLPCARRRAASSSITVALGGLGRRGCAAPAPGGEHRALGSSPLSSTGLVRPLTARRLSERAAGARVPVTPEGGTVGRGRGAGAGRRAGTREPGAGGAGCG